MRHDALLIRRVGRGVSMHKDLPPRADTISWRMSPSLGRTQHPGTLMRFSIRSTSRTAPVMLASLFALLLVARPALAQGKGGHDDHGHGNGNGHGHHHHHDRSNPKPPKHDDHDKDHDKGKGNDSHAKAPDPKDKAKAHFEVASAPGASSIATPAQATFGALRSGTLTSRSGSPIPAEPQKAVLSAFSSDGESLPLYAALTSNGNEHAGKQAKRLVESLHGVSDNPDRLPGAVKAYNALVDASSAQFLSAPPAEFLAVQAALTPMAREATVASSGP
jgi:hypothetical protein